MDFPTAIPIACLAATTALAQAQWRPQWASEWHDPALGTALPIALRLAADGSVFAAVDNVRPGTNYATIVRFDADGRFAWLRERAVQSTAGMELLGEGRIALVAEPSSGTDGALVRVIDAASGDLIWERSAGDARLRYDNRNQTHVLARAANGELLVRASNAGDVVVIRHDADGNALPPWRWTSAWGAVVAEDIVAVADGGAWVSGRYDGGSGIEDGYFVVRFDAEGGAFVVDLDADDIGPPQAASLLALDAAGNAIVAAEPESRFGAPHAQVWKLAPDGTVLWAVAAPSALSPTLGMLLGGVAVAADGDVLFEAHAASETRFRLLRLDGASGRVRQAEPAAIGRISTTLALASDGRVLIGGYDSDAANAARIAEFDAFGRPCRFDAELHMSTRVKAAATDGAWTVLGVGPSVAGVGNEVLVRRYDANGACSGDADRIFGNGFDGAD